jgi:hypothetical protein
VLDYFKAHRGRVVLAFKCKAPSARGDWTIPAQRWRSCKRAQSDSPIRLACPASRGRNSTEYVQYVWHDPWNVDRDGHTVLQYPRG